MRDLPPSSLRSPYELAGTTQSRPVVAATIFVNGRESAAMVVTPTDVRDQVRIFWMPKRISMQPAISGPLGGARLDSVAAPAGWVLSQILANRPRMARRNAPDSPCFSTGKIVIFSGRLSPKGAGQNSPDGQTH